LPSFILNAFAALILDPQNGARGPSKLIKILFSHLCTLFEI
jgi:hypothetical protein